MNADGGSVCCHIFNLFKNKVLILTADRSPTPTRLCILYKYPSISLKALPLVEVSISKDIYLKKKLYIYLFRDTWKH